MTIEVRRLVKKYGRLAVLKEISFTLKQGEITGFLGPNGAGKSTTINILSGLLQPDSGDILLNSNSIFSGLNNWKRNIGVVLEDLALFDHLTIEDNMKIMGHLYRLPEGLIQNRTEELLNFFDLRDYKDTMIREASSGMKKKTAVALSLIHSPGVLFFDEAFTGIDAVTIKKIKELLFSLKRKGVIILLSSHILDSVEGMVDRCFIMDKGIIIKDITKESLGQKTLEDYYIDVIGDNKKDNSTIS